MPTAADKTVELCYRTGGCTVQTEKSVQMLFVFACSDAGFMHS